MAAAKRTRSQRTTSSARKRGSGRRDTVKAKSATLYAKRTGRGQFKEMDEKGAVSEKRPPCEGQDQDEVWLRGSGRPGSVSAH